MGRQRATLDVEAIRALVVEGNTMSLAERQDAGLTRRQLGHRFGVSATLVTQIAMGYRSDINRGGRAVRYNQKPTAEQEALAKSPTCGACGQSLQHDVDVNGFAFEWCANGRCRDFSAVPPIRDILAERLRLMVARGKGVTP